MDAIKRSVDSLQKIYAVIIALAIGNSANVIFKDIHSLNDLNSLVPHLPATISFFFLIVPFYHGMNRHLDLCYLEKNDTFIKGALILDFFIFCFEAILFFILSIFIKSGLITFALLGVILIFDTIWAYISHWIHYRGVKPTIRTWALINALTVILGFLTYSISWISNKEVIYLILILIRTFLDYKFCFNFYFPDPKNN